MNLNSNQDRTQREPAAVITALSEDVTLITFPNTRVPRPDEERELAEVPPKHQSPYNILPGAMNSVYKTNRRGKKRNKK
jgi:hypothetical protein